MNPSKNIIDPLLMLFKIYLIPNTVYHNTYFGTEVISIFLLDVSRNVTELEFYIGEVLI